MSEAVTTRDRCGGPARRYLCVLLWLLLVLLLLGLEVDVDEEVVTAESVAKALATELSIWWSGRRPSLFMNTSTSTALIKSPQTPQASTRPLYTISSGGLSIWDKQLRTSKTICRPSLAVAR